MNGAAAFAHCAAFGRFKRHSHLLTARDGVEIAIDDRFAVKHDLDLAALDRDLLSVPFTERLEALFLRRLNAVDRAVILI